MTKPTRIPKATPAASLSEASALKRKKKKKYFVPTVSIAVNIVIRENEDSGKKEFLLIEESSKKKKRAGLWYLPAGRIDPGEDLETGLRRETREEAEVEVTIKGLVVLQQINYRKAGSTKLRYVMLSEQDGNERPKPLEHANKESEQAKWFTLDEIHQLPLRGGDEIIRLIKRSQQSPPLAMDHIDMFHV